MPMYYTGVGSRETPQAILEVMTRLAVYLAQHSLVLRSGAAEGADTAFEVGCDKVNPQLKQIFLPWDGFNERSSREHGVIAKLQTDIEARASRIAQEIHPAWDKLSQGAKKLHTRNVYQVLGPCLEKPSGFLVAYATLDKNGEPKGGTRTAIKLAQKRNIRIYNLFIAQDLERVTKLLQNCGI